MFKDKIKALRESNCLTQEEFAEKLAVSRAAVSKWETGKGYPSVDSLKLISELFDVTIDELVSDRAKTEGLTIELGKKSKRSIIKIAAIILLCLFACYIIQIVYDTMQNRETKLTNVATDEVVYWENNRSAFTYKGEAYTSVPIEELGGKAFDGKASRYFSFSCYWQVINDKSNAVFNVQDAKQGPLDNLFGAYNRATMYKVENPVENNLYIASYGNDFFMPEKSKDKVQAYYADMNHYDWNVIEWIFDSKGCTTTAAEPIPLQLQKEEIKALSKMVTNPINANTIDWDNVNNGDYVELEMISKDGVLYGRMWLNRYKGEWYTCANRDAEESSPQQIAAKLPKAIGDKIESLLE